MHPFKFKLLLWTIALFGWVFFVEVALWAFNLTHVAVPLVTAILFVVILKGIHVKNARMNAEKKDQQRKEKFPISRLQSDLGELARRGFNERTLNAVLLEQFDYDIEKVLDRLADTSSHVRNGFVSSQVHNFDEDNLEALWDTARKAAAHSPPHPRLNYKAPAGLAYHAASLCVGVHSRLQPIVLGVPGFVVGVPRTAFAASGLPAGLLIDNVTGDIHGTPTETVSVCRVTVTAFNGTGSCVATVEITVTAESGARNRDGGGLSARLPVAAASNNQHVVLQTAEAKWEPPASDELPEGWESEFGREAALNNPSSPGSTTMVAPSAGASGGGGGAAASLDENRNAVKVWLRKISLEQYSDEVLNFGYDSMDALFHANEKQVIEMTEFERIGMKKPHRTLFLNAWKTLLKTSLSPQRTFISKKEEFEHMIAEYDPSSGLLSKDQFTKICRAIQNGSNPFESTVGAGKFCTEPKEIVMGNFQQAAGGLFKLMNVDKNETVAKVLRGVPAVKEEVEKLKTNKKYSKYYAEVSKYLNYILYEPASELEYPNGIRDKGRAGKTFSYFAGHRCAKEADLDEAEVVALRLYTTPAFKAFNEPLRNMEEGVEHPLPVLVTILAEAIKKLRQIGSNDIAAVQEKVLWRGMKNLKPSDEFKTRGGTELAPMSTTTDIKTAVEYSLSSESLIFMIVTKNALRRGASLSWLSAFPTEEEICFSPLTFLQPTGRKQVVEINSMRFTIVQVEPSS